MSVWAAMRRKVGHGREVVGEGVGRWVGEHGECGGEGRAGRC